VSEGRIRDADLEEVKKRSELVEVAGEYMQLRRAGRLYKGLCPFHQEKTPSFSIDPAKGLYFCFGCQEGGDVITLVSKIENLGFTEAVESLARRAGVDLQYERLTPGEASAKKRRLRLIDAHRDAIDLYHRLLLEDERASAARAYLAGRGFGREVAARYSMGFAPPAWDVLVTHLRDKGYGAEELVAAGLVSKTNDGRLVDRFRNRIMFPTFDVRGEPVAFGARRMEEGDGPKYLNSSESPIYKKGAVLYGLNWARSAIVNAARAVVVEGYTDVIALQTAGIEEAVATCGTALGIDHLRGLQRFTQRVVLSLDSDEAGGKAAERMYDQLIGEAQGLGLSVQVLLMPRGSDPADTVVSEGAEAFGERVENAVPLLEFVLRREADRYRVGDPEVRARALAAGLRLLSKTDSEVVRMEYARRLSDWIKVDANIIFVELERIMTTGTAPNVTTDVFIKRSTSQVRLEREALKLALQHPALVKAHVEETGANLFSVPAHRALWSVIVDGRDPAAESMDEETRRAYTELSVQPVDGETTDRLVAEVFTRLKEFVLTRHIDDVKMRLQQINPVDDADGHNALFTELIDLERSKRALTEGDR
jgi:DNA primase